MKKTIISILLCFATHFSFAQNDLEWVKANYTGLYYHTNTHFTWTGGSNAGYCNGYGTIQFYDDDGSSGGKYVGNVRNGMNEGYGTQYYSNGNKLYEGYWKSDKRSGYGTKYNRDGTTAYQGNFVDGDLEGIAPLNYAANAVGNFVMQKIFDGGLNLQTRIVKLSDGDVRIRITFNGDIITTNYYAMTLVIKNSAPYVDFFDYNDNADTYLKLKLTATVMQGIHDLFESNSSNN